MALRVIEICSINTHLLKSLRALFPTLVEKFLKSTSLDSLYL